MDVIAIIAASAGVIVLHHLGIIPETYVISILLTLLALHALQEALRGEEIKEDIKTIAKNVQATDSEVELIKPRELLVYTEEFALKNRGEVWWFNACCTMFRSQELFDRLLRISIESSKTTRIIFVMDLSMKEAWERDIRPKIEKCRDREKVQEPVWCNIDESIAFQMIDVGVGKEAKEALLAFWGEPFMMELGSKGQHVPRYLIHVKSQSGLISRLQDIFVKCRLKNSGSG
ncbi:MAG: hypothetical protein BWY65_01981 [Firmicutes bacterium ADurb.Bin373]|nr:MAG: hypothetical protein BWY65_01981 [Firmicutes bacterium ADurb.Bin373]